MFQLEVLSLLSSRLLARGPRLPHQAATGRTFLGPNFYPFPGSPVPQLRANNLRLPTPGTVN